MPTLRPGTVDEMLWTRQMAEEYAMIGEMRATDVVLDLGAHIGSFAKFAWERGSRVIHSYEASFENVEIAAGNLIELGILSSNGGEGVVLNYGAVVRSDARRDDAVFLDAYPRADENYLNTGAASLFLGAGGERVPTITLDHVIENASIRLMKIDIEGSEWPVLYTCTKLRQIEEIVGEYHYLPPGVADALALPYPADVDGLRLFFEDYSFEVISITEPFGYQRPGGYPIGIFHARRREIGH